MIALSIEKKLKSAAGEMLLKVDCEIAAGSFVTLYGKSGAGKTSVLRILAGLLAPEKGSISVNGSTWLDSTRGVNLSPQQRKAGFVFQDYALFPNMTVKENLLFALEKGQEQRIVQDLIEIIELGELQSRKPATLSGGQKQRVALARALVQQPEILLLDEPLSALDIEMRKKLQQHILQVHREYQFTAILVSHDVSEILKMSDILLVLEQGKIIKQGRATEIFSTNELGPKIQFTGIIKSIEQQGLFYTLSLQIGKKTAKVSVTAEEAKKLVVGDQLMVFADAINPVVKKM